MEAFGMLQFRRNAAAGGDGDELKKAAALGTDDEETDDEESFFDLVLKSPDREAASKDFQFIKSPKNVFMSKIDDFSDLNASSPVTPLHSISSNPNSRVFKLGLSKSSKCEKLTEYDCELKAKQFSKCGVKSKETSDRRASSRDAVRKYLERIKPLYVKVSKQNNDKSKFTEHSTTSSSPPVNFSTSKFSGSRMGSFKMATKHLQKSRSASAAEIDAALPPVRRKDDSLLEQNDGIRGAILHCKKSYNSSKEVSHEKLGPLGRNTDATAFD
ncbi:hypothetical protein BUALT_Bualt01G0074500 [Buddleja alternifolia]|uniref:Membrane-associated kinase regulator 2 n=1 Tax=Buddleja alternifolia TaxID=168488 RepID=A0AAV6Y584_9LAMI|nr:hypothetical protein BUALT_Bualt01G0074500 [Buddleja alternifolia]